MTKFPMEISFILTTDSSSHAHYCPMYILWDCFMISASAIYYGMSYDNFTERAKVFNLYTWRLISPLL